MERAVPRRADGFGAEVRKGLTSTPKRLDPKYFYDPLGSALFAAICELPEYYVTRAEREILDRFAVEIARHCGRVDRLIELGSGNAHKTQQLIAPLFAANPRLLYQPIDIDGSLLDDSKRGLALRFPDLAVEPHCGDYTDIAALGTISGRTAVLFLGSSIGNLDHDTASSLLRIVGRVVTAGDALLIGFDLKKSKPIMEAAYDDPLGVTAAFNRNLLVRINRELRATFRLDRFRHRAFFNELESRIEMHLVSTEPQTVRIAALELDVSFERGESIHTENSHKYDTAAIEALATASGLRIERQWTDPRAWFTDVLLRPDRE